MPNSSSSQRFWQGVGMLPAAVFLSLLIGLKVQSASVSLESPFLLAFLNTVFLCGIPLAVAYLAAKSHQATGAFAFLLVGCGMVFFGVSSLYAGWVMPLAGGPNPTVTLHNLGCLFAGVCQFVGAHYFLHEVMGTPTPPARLWRYEFLYVGIAGLVSVAAVLAFLGKLPAFFDPNTGPSLLRQLVLGGAIGLFAVAGLMFVEIAATAKTEFAYWYGLALWLIALGLVGVWLQPTVGSLLGWTGRGAQYVGSVYFILAFLQGRRELRAADMPSADRTTRGLWPYLEQRVRERTTALTQAIEALQKEVAARKQIEAALRESQAQLQAILDNSSTLIYVEDLEGRLTLVNRKFASVFGLSREALVGKTSYDLMSKEMADSHWANDLEVVGKRTSVSVEEVNDEPDGRHTYLSVKFPLLDGAGEVYGLCGISTDITERKQVETARRQSEASLNKAQRVAKVGSWAWHIPTNQLEWSDQMFSIFGMAQANFSGDLAEVMARAIHPEDRAEVDRANLSVMRDRQPVPLEYRVVWPDGTVRGVWAEAGELTLDDAGQPLMLTGIVQDITERKQAEEALRESEARFRLAFDLSPVIKARIALDGRFLEANSAACAFFGYSERELLTRSIYDVTHPDDVAPTVAVVRSLLNSEQPTGQIEKRFVRPDGSFVWALVSTIVMRTAAGEPLYRLSEAQDITARKQAEALIRHQADQLQAQNEELVAQGRALALTGAEVRAVNANLEARVEARTHELSLANAALARAARMKDEFLASMSHELRTPLAGILGLAEVLQRGIQGPLTDKQLKSLGLIEESGQHLLALINDILDVSKVEAGKVELELGPVTAAEICQVSVQFVKQLALQKRLRLSATVDVKAVTLRADARRLKQILVNLLSNAVKFTPEGGEVGLEVRGEAAQKQVRFTVWDTGIGIAPADLEKLFKPFVQLDSRLAREYSGTGLGLSLVMGLAKLHGGAVTVESTLGQGSRFSVILPWTPAEEPPAPNLPSALPVALATVRQALVVEDSPIAADQLTQYLTALGIRNVVLAEGGGVVEKAVEVRPDVIFLDLLLPDIPGWDVLKGLKTDPRTQAIPVIIVSVVDERAQADALGVVGYLVKPVGLSDLQNALSRGMALAAQRPAQSALVVPLGAAPAPSLLLAEDSDYVIASLVDFLEARSYRVTVARDGGEALNQARALRPNLILMDIQMPGLDGLEVTRRLRADPDVRLASVPIIALTALAMPGDRERCLAAGATDYMSKPVQLGQLLYRIRTLLGQTAAPGLG